MRIVLIGAGNLATSLGHALRKAGHDILQVYSRTLESADMLARSIDALAVNDVSDIIQDADFYVISIKDSVLEEVAKGLTLCAGNPVVVHTAGSMGMDVFEGCFVNYGVLYPMQTFSKERVVDFKDIHCFVEGVNDYSVKVISEVAESISANVHNLSSADRRYLHLAAVFACNFVNHCFALSSDILSRHGMSLDVMAPLINETVSKAYAMAPQDAQTGPAVRYDSNVIDSHCSMLDSLPMHRSVYDIMSKSIHEMSKARRK